MSTGKLKTKKAKVSSLKKQLGLTEVNVITITDDIVQDRKDITSSTSAETTHQAAFDKHEKDRAAAEAAQTAATQKLATHTAAKPHNTDELKGKAKKSHGIAKGSPTIHTHTHT